MRLFLGLLIFTAALISCSSPEKLMQQGDYDAIIEKTVKNLIKNPSSEEDAVMLDKAWKLANQRDIERINYLKLENNPNTWDEMLSLYSTLKNRQASVRRVLPLRINGQSVQYDFVDYDAEIVLAKKKAADYYNKHGRQLMENRDKNSYRQAYYELVKAKNYSGDSYYDLDEIIGEARYKGMSRVLVSVVNQTILNLPQEFSDGLISVNSKDLNSEWVEYYTRKPSEKIEFDYFVDIILKGISVSPDLVKDRDFIEKRTIDDGFQYILDTKGNVMKDSAGNDIKIKKYKDIQCTLIETRQTKECNITGEVEFISTNPESLLKKQPINAVTHFEYVSARAIGDIDALSTESRRLITVKPVPFPTDMDMIFDCTEALKGSIYDAVNYNRGLLR
jgi:hypothetical protein